MTEAEVAEKARQGMCAAADYLGAMHADLSPRSGCCMVTRKPCAYHEGWYDALDIAEQRMRKLT